MKRKIIVITIISTLLLGILLYFFIFSNKEELILEINGNDIKLPYGELYNEMGAIAKVCKKNKCLDVSNQIEISNNIDQTNTGKYEVEYKIKYNNQTKELKRNVEILDTTPPIITLAGAKEIKLCPNIQYQEEGYDALDNYDGNITNNVKIENSDEAISYSVKDSSNNETIVKRTIVREELPNPSIQLIGAKEIIIKVGETYTEYGVIAKDGCGEDISNNIKISSNLDSNKVGTYTITYTVSDNYNNSSSTTRTVIVKNNEKYLPNQSKEQYINELEKYIKSQNYHVSIGYVNLKSGYTYKYNENEEYYGASLAKTVDVLYLLENNLITSEVRNQIRLVSTISDNDSHHKLVEYIGIDNLRKFGEKIGCQDFLKTGYDSDHFGQTTVSDQIAIWKYFYQHIDEYGDIGLKSYFFNDFYNYLEFPNAPVMAHKYGYYGSFYHDTGIIYSNNPYIIVILTKHGENNFQNVVRDLSEKMYNLNQIDN